MKEEKITPEAQKQPSPGEFKGGGEGVTINHAAGKCSEETEE